METGSGGQSGAPGPAEESPREGRATGTGGRAPWYRPGTGVVTWALLTLYFAYGFDRRWIPHDEGTLAQTAWRVLLGQMPHRDFDDMYTGLLTYLHAGAMHLMGVDLYALRVVLLIAFVLWVPTVWSLARRFAEPSAAALCTALAVTLGPAVYPASMPTWYNLFLATWALWCLLRWTEGGRTGWLAAAGFAVGVSVLFKIVGLYSVAAVLFFLIHRAVLRAGPRASPARRRLLPLAGGAFVALVAIEVALVRSQASVATFVWYVLPTAALALAAVVAGGAGETAGAGTSLRSDLVAPLAVAGGAAALPMVGWVVFYAAHGALHALMHGVLQVPLERLAATSYAPPGLLLTAGALVPFLALVAASLLPERRTRLLAVAAAAVGVILLALWTKPVVYRAVWLSTPLLIPFTVTAGAWVLARRRGPRSSRLSRERLAAVLWAPAVLTLVQFPFANPIYLAYVAPLGILALFAVMAAGAPEGKVDLGRGAGPLLAALATFSVCFLAIGPDRGGIMEPSDVVDVTTPLALPRGGIDVPIEDAVIYESLVHKLQRVSTSRYTFATPDAPQVYFLSGLRNPTRTLFDAFADPHGRVARVLAALHRHHVNAIVLNTSFIYSRPSLPLIDALQRRYPEAMRIGPFILRWRGPTPPHMREKPTSGRSRKRGRNVGGRRGVPSPSR